MVTRLLSVPQFLLMLLVVISTTSAQHRLDSFKREAEKALGRSVKIIETVEGLGIANGATYCELDPVLINIRPGLAEELRIEVEAHELGHALLCGRGIKFEIGPAKQIGGVPPILDSLGAAIGSCYIDPLADAEAAQRGFVPSKTVDDIFRKTKTHTKEEIHNSILNNGELAADLTTINIYCIELRPHSFSIEELEKVFEDEPSVLMKLGALKRRLDMPKCSDAASCFYLTIRLRDEFWLGKLILIQNPRTGLI
jgi:hypothetical protein